MIKQFLSNLFDLRENPVSTVLFYEGQTVPVEQNVKAFLEEGYKVNPIVYRCINEIAGSGACAGITIKSGEADITSGNIYDLIRRPNIVTGRKAFFQTLITDLLATGNAYCATNEDAGSEPTELWRLDPTKIEVKAGKAGIPSQYVFKGSRGTKTFEVDTITGKSPVLHIKLPNPFSSLIGMSPLQAAALAGDTHNAASKWNYSLIKNGAKPSLAIKASSQGSVDKETKARLEEYFTRRNQGEDNAGRPLVLGNMEIEKLSMSPSDMDFLNTIMTNERYICLVYNVPHVLVTGDNSTFSNVKEARESLWENAIIPLFDMFLDELGLWLSQQFGQSLEICIDRDTVSALEPKRERKFDRVIQGLNNALMTPNEAREQVGLTPMKGGDQLLVGANKIPLEDVGLLSDPVPGGDADE